MSRQPRRSVIRSFRVDQAALEIIERDAQEKHISVNTLVNELILAYVNLDRYLDAFPMVKISSVGLGVLLEGVSDEYAKVSARRVAQNVVQSQIMSMRGDLSLIGWDPAGSLPPESSAGGLDLHTSALFISPIDPMLS